MSSNKELQIPFVGLKEGIHEFEFKIDDKFFEDHEFAEIEDCVIDVDMSLEKSSNMMVLNFDIQGNMQFPCDRCLETMQVPIASENRLVVKYGEEHREEAEDVLVIANNEYELDLTQHLFEYIMVSLPQRKVHEDGECDEEVIKKLKEYETHSTEGIDPRWSELDKLKS